MKKILLVLIVGVVLFVGVSKAQSLSGKEIIEKSFNRYDGDSSRAELAMTLIDKHGKERVRRLVLVTKDFGQQIRTYLEFTEPNNIEGTKFLSIENEGADDSQYLYLPALKKTRRIVSTQKTVRFVNTDFSYEDMQRRLPKKDEHTLLKEENYLGLDCFVVESRPVSGTSQYSRRLSWVDSQRFVVVKTEFYDKKNQLVKEYAARELVEIDGIWTVTDSVMRDLVQNHSTVMRLSNISYNCPVDDNLFSVYSLEKGI